MKTPPVVSREKWLEARRDLLKREKELSRANDELAKKRRELPWVKITKDYEFDGPNGKVSLADLFDGRDQLMVYHFMYSPSWDEGCVGCSFLCDHVDGARQHFEHNDLSFVAVSRAPLSKLEAYRQRMGWKFRWVSAAHTDFNYDFNVSFPADRVKDGKITYNFEEIDAYPDTDELPGVSLFYKDKHGDIYHTYSTYARGGEALLGAYHFLDLAPLGRRENDGNGNLSDWVRRHDRYPDDGRSAKDSCCQQEEPAASSCGCSSTTAPA